MVVLSASVPFSRESKPSKNPSLLFYSPLFGQVYVMWPPLAGRETRKVKCKVFFHFQASIMEGSRAKGILKCLLGQPIDSIYATGSKWLKQCGKQEVCAPEQAALTIRLCCTTVVLIIPWSVKETWSCLHGPRKQRSTPVNLKLKIPVCAKG